MAKARNYKCIYCSLSVKGKCKCDKCINEIKDRMLNKEVRLHELIIEEIMDDYTCKEFYFTETSMSKNNKKLLMWIKKNEEYSNKGIVYLKMVVNEFGYEIPATVGKTYTTGNSCDVSFSTETNGETRIFLKENIDYKWLKDKVLIIYKANTEASKLEKAIQKRFKLFGK